MQVGCQNNYQDVLIGMCMNGSAQITGCVVNGSDALAAY